MRSDNVPCQAAQDIVSNGPALVFNNVTALETVLPLSSVLDALATDADPLATTGVSSQAAIVQSMIDTFSFSEFINTDALNTFGLAEVPVDQRPNEAQMLASQFVSDMRPSAIFNRLDLAPADGSDCGEQRIIYSLMSGSSLTTLPFQDFTLIFEARYPNPSPLQGADGCRPIAEFYASLTDPSITDADRAQSLADFFLNGVTVTDSVTGQAIQLPAVVTVANYQGMMGQIRTNQFIDLNWQLREFRTNVTASDTVELIPDTIKGNPITALYSAAASQAYNNNAGIPVTMRDDFINDFFAVQLPLLAAPELAGITDANDILVGFEPAFENKFSQFTSDASAVDDPAAVADQNFRDEIDDELQNMGIPATELNSDHILNRLGAMTCGGCHQFSAGEPVSPSVAWPDVIPAGFKHVENDGSLSPTLLNTLLPKRRAAILQRWLCAEEEPECEEDSDCDDGFICQDNECVEEVVDPCDDVECPVGSSCVDGECIEDEPTACYQDSDCPDHLVCESGECVEPSTSECETSADCARGQRCIDGHCVEPSVPECRTHRDCPRGHRCIEGECVEPVIPECRTSRDCERGERCVDNRCVSPAPVECDTDRHCGRGEVCIEGRCHGEAEPECRSDRDCPRGSQCDGGFCQAQSNGGVCDLPMSLVSGPGQFNGQTNALSAAHSGTCGGGGTESVVRFQPRKAGAYCLTTVGSDFDTTLHVRQGACDSAELEVACNDDIRRGQNSSSLTVRVDGRTPHYVFIDSELRGQGQWQLNVRPGSCRSLTSAHVARDIDRDSAERSPSTPDR